MRRSLWNIFIDWVAERIEVEIDDSFSTAAVQDQLQNCNLVFLSRRPSAMHTALLQRVLLKAGLPVPLSLRFSEGDNFRRSRHLRLTVRSYLRPRRGTESLRFDPRRHRKRLLSFLDDLIHFDRRRKTAVIPFAVFTGRGGRLIHKDAIAWFDFDYFPTLDILRAVIFALFRDHVELRIGAPIFPESDEQLTGLLRKVSRRIYGWEKLVQAARSPSPESLSRVVLSGPRYERVARELSLAESASLFQIQSRAERILYSMAARFHSWGIGLLYLILRRVLPRMFSIRIDGLDTLKRTIGRSPVVVIPSHRSHFDYIILSYLFFTGGLPLPHVAAGDNLNFWPVGRLLRSGGAFFIRRKIDRDDRLYKTVLDSYLTMLMKQGQVIEFFIEGGRSRSGAMLAPRFGLLKYLVRAYLLGYREDLAFVPISITYDRVVEERALLKEQAGGKKESESILQLLRLIPRLRRSFGGVTVVIGEPISMRSSAALRQNGPAQIAEQKGSAEAAPAETPSANELTANLGIELTRKIQSGTVMTPRSLLSLVLADLDRRGGGPRELDGPKVAARITDLFQLLEILEGPAGRLPGSYAASPPELAQVIKKLPLHTSSSLALLLEQPDWAGFIKALAGELVSDEGDICKFEPEAAGRFLPVQGSALRRDFYRNTVLNHFVSPLLYLMLGQPGVVSTNAVDEIAAFQQQGVRMLHELLTPIMLLPEWETWSADFNTQGDLLAAGGFISWISAPAGAASGWKVEAGPWSRHDYLLWSIRALLEALQSSLAVAFGLDREGLDEAEFNQRARNGTVQLVTTSMLGWVREFLIGRGVLQKLVLDRGNTGTRLLGVIPADLEAGQALFRFVLLILGSSPSSAAGQPPLAAPDSRLGGRSV